MNDVMYCDVVSCSPIDKDSIGILARLYEAPAYSGLEQGDIVVVETDFGGMVAFVNSVETRKADEFPNLSRVLKFVVCTPIDWKSIDEERKERGIVETEEA